MSIEYIRRTYDVDARVGGRVIYRGGAEPMQGTITGTSSGHLLIRLDGQKHSNPYHPTWKLEYLPNQKGDAA